MGLERTAMVMQGKRNLTEDSLIKFAAGLELNKQEEEYFRNLVFLNQAQTPDIKNSYLKQMLRSKKVRQMKRIERQHYEYYSTWYHPVVRELVVAKGCSGTPEEVAEKIAPPITTAQAAKSIALLESLGFIQKTESGKWRQSSSIISTSPELEPVVIHNYHKAILDLAKSRMDALPSEQQQSFCMTLGIHKDRIPQLRAKLREFQSEIFKLVSEDINPEEVVLLNVNLFPVTQPKGGGGAS
jgi:uncharacterized protein (TIGR02147 family)